MKKDYSPMLVKAIRTFLVDDDWHFSFDEERGLFNFGLSLKNRLKNVKFIIDVKENEYIVYAICPINADIDDQRQMIQINEFVNRANYGLKNGNFELDVRDGEIRYKSYVDCKDCQFNFPNTSVIRDSILVPAAMFNRYGDGIVRVLFGGASAKETITEIEG